jgi:hypothetical protein
MKFPTMGLLLLKLEVTIQDAYIVEFAQGENKFSEEFEMRFS